MCFPYRFRSINPCISRCGSPVRKDCPNTPIDEIDGFFQRQFLPLPQQRLLRAQRLGAAFQQRLDGVLHRGIEAAFRRDHVDQAPGERSGRIDIFGRHDQPAGAAPADQPRQQRGMDDRGNADATSGMPKCGVVRGNAEIAGGGEFQPAAEAPAGHPRDNRRRKGARRPRRDRAAGDECFRRGSGRGLPFP